MSKLRDHYDWIVIGDHPGALLSASLAAKLGLSALVVPLFPSRGVMIGAKGGFIDPESNLLLGLAESSLWGRCLNQAGMRAADRAFFASESASPQILTPKSRVVLDSLGAELSREWGDSASRRVGFSHALAHAEEGVRAYWSALPERLTLLPKTSNVSPPSTSWGPVRSVRDALQSFQSLRSSGNVAGLRLSGSLRRNLPNSSDKGGTLSARQWFSEGALLSQWEESHFSASYGEFLLGTWTALTGMSPRNAEQFDLLQLAALRPGAVSVLGGMNVFRELLTRLARQNGVDVLSKAECQRIFVQNGRFAGVQPSGRGEMISAEGGILGLPLSLALPFISNAGGTRLKRMRPAPQSAGWVFTLALSVHAEAIPPGVSRRMVWQERDAPGIEIELARAQDYGITGPHADRQQILLRTLMPMSTESLAPQFQRMTAARMLRKLTEILPFLDFHIERIYPDFRTEDARELTEVYGFGSLDAVPPNLMSFSQPGFGSQTGIEGLFLSSSESYPGLGSLGMAVSALEGIAWIAHRSGLPGPFAQAGASEGRNVSLPL
jgi:hypothetical protein